MNEDKLTEIIRPLDSPAYTATFGPYFLFAFFEGYMDGVPEGRYEMNPDFQRGRVWSIEKKISYIENLIKGIAPRTFIFNCPDYTTACENEGKLEKNVLVCVDGLQRITAIDEFIKGEFKIFGNRLTAEDLKRTKYDLKRIRLDFQLHKFETRKELLQFYLDINSGGVVHSESELDRVRSLLAKEKGD